MAYKFVAVVFLVWAVCGPVLAQIDLTTPALPEIGSPGLPEVELPEITTPEIPEVNVPELTTPETPSLPVGKPGRSRR